jgi:teichoic acid transport system permease protein
MTSAKDSTNPSSSELDSGLVPANQPMPLVDYIAELWQRRDFLVRVPLEDLKTQNAHTLLGGIWFLLNPLLQVGVYFFVFGVIIRVDQGIEQYLAFLTIGVFVFLYTQRVVTEGARSVVANIGLVRTVRFPRATLPISSTVGQVLAFGPVLAVMLIVVLAHGNWPHIRWLLVPAVFILQTSFSLGAGFIAARYNHTYRDLESLLPFVFRLLFYLSGVLYSVDRMVANDALRILFLANPLYCFVTIWRWALIGTQASGDVWIASVMWSVISLSVGFKVFRDRENSYGGTE